MTRKRIKHEQITNERKMNGIFEKRAEGLLKKAQQLCILCGIDIAIVAHKQGGESNGILWPSPEAFGERLQKFLSFTAVERAKKMVTHEKYTEQALRLEMEGLAKLKKAADMKGAQQLLYYLSSSHGGYYKCLNDLDLHQLDGLSLLTEEMLKALKRRDDELIGNSGEQRAPAAAFSVPTCPHHHCCRCGQIGDGGLFDCPEGMVRQVGSPLSSISSSRPVPKFLQNHLQ